LKARSFLLQGGKPAKPGMVKVTDNTGSSVELEIWELEVSHLEQRVITSMCTLEDPKNSTSRHLDFKTLVTPNLGVCRADSIQVTDLKSDIFRIKKKSSL
jgi:hypothetical protein